VDFIRDLRTRAAALGARIAFAEAADPRVQAAAKTLKEERIAEPVVVLDGRVRGPSTEWAHGLDVVDPARDSRRERVVADLLKARGPRGLQPAQAEALALDPIVFADYLVSQGDVTGSVAGCVATSASVIRAALLLVGLEPGVKTLSSAFYMVTHPFREERSEVLTFTDCAVVPYPTVEQLADIAIAAARDRRRIVGDEPRIAFLSFSTRGSAEGESVERVRLAVQQVRSREPQLAVDGELQVDAALMSSVGERKAPGSDVAGRANVLVFPSLDAGNIGYKLVERVGRASAIGPILQGLVRPCNDLSRGASPDDIINTAAVTALQGAPAEG
jgi:phosphate acetyltransferase